jgi:hypothetical protein
MYAVAMSKDTRQLLAAPAYPGCYDRCGNAWRAGDNQGFLPGKWGRRQRRNADVHAGTTRRTCGVAAAEWDYLHDVDLALRFPALHAMEYCLQCIDPGAGRRAQRKLHLSFRLLETSRSEQLNALHISFRKDE